MNFRIDHDLTLDIIENQLVVLAERQCDLHATQWDQARLAGVQHKAAEALAKVAQPDDVHCVARRAIPVADVEDHSREDVIAELVQVEYAGLVRLAYARLHDRSRIEDVVMETFSSRYGHWSGMRRKSAPLTCLRTEVLYGSRSRVRALVRERTGRPLSEVGVPDPSSAGVIAGDEAQLRAERVPGLPARQRKVTLCRSYLEPSEAETAELLRITIGAVKRHAHRGRKALFTTVKVAR